MKIFFATDIHGSDVCFKKLLNAQKFYQADIVILGGDMTGKMVIPIYKMQNGNFQSEILQQNFILKTKDELQKYISNTANMGLYPYLTDEDEMKTLHDNKTKADDIFKKLIVERLTQWVELADKKMKVVNSNLFVCPGNDDDYFIDDILKQSTSIINLENKVFDISEEYQILSTGHSNLTPWHTPREISENELEKVLTELSQKVNINKATIYNIHVPPYDSKIDECAELDSEFRVMSSLGQIKKQPVGSTAVRKIIEKNHPMLGLFGHVHEGKGMFNLNGTLCFNPGSNYQEGVLNGCLLNLGRHIVTGYQFITG
ncbi:MAG: metallophosphoesterase [Bacteroidia bacterium]|nr:metallophosphoesterase [Bacteroidia bacterium]